MRVGRSAAVAWLKKALKRHYRWFPGVPPPLSHWNSSAPPYGPRSLDVPSVPEPLRTEPGIRRDPSEEAKAYQEVPLYRFPEVQPEIGEKRGIGSEWVAHVPLIPLSSRVQARIDAESVEPSRTAGDPLNPPALTRSVKEHALELGLSAVGVAQLDPKYIYEKYRNVDLGDKVIVCVLEMNWEASQSTPSARNERANVRTTGEMGDLCRLLARYLRGLGYGVTGPLLAYGYGISIHYAVQAGLGQLGMNGQLLTPFAGSRCRLMLLHTDAPLLLDRPVDYGIPGICDACKICVRRCPSGAIPAQRKLHRGVYKTKIKLDRCAPMLVQAYGCAVCMKVCPVQRFGLPAVLEEYQKTGQVLGKGTDELEGYRWPVDGRFYGAGEKPKSAVTWEALHPMGLNVDPARKRPVGEAQSEGSGRSE